MSSYRKVQAIQNALEPHNQSSLKSYLDYIVVLFTFSSNLPNTSAPLYYLLHKAIYSGNEGREREREREREMPLKPQRMYFYHCMF